MPFPVDMYQGMYQIWSMSVYRAMVKGPHCPLAAGDGTAERPHFSMFLVRGNGPAAENNRLALGVLSNTRGSWPYETDVDRPERQFGKFFAQNQIYSGLEPPIEYPRVPCSGSDSGHLECSGAARSAHQPAYRCRRYS